MKGLLLCSATPSLEAYNQSINGKINLIRLATKFGSFIKIHVVSNYRMFNAYTIQRCQEIIDNGGQIICFYNRRGYASFVYCKKCETRQICACGSNLILHLNKDSYSKELICHVCRKKTDFYCVVCKKQDNLKTLGMGIEKIKETLEKIIKNSKVELFSTDTAHSNESIKIILQKMNNKEINILVGTSMIIKGHNFNSVNLVVVVDFQTIGWNFDAVQLLFQNLVQVAGRAGRQPNQEAELIIQSNKEHYLIDFLKQGDYENFLLAELEVRKKWNLPPFCRLIRFVPSKKIIGKIKAELEPYVDQLYLLPWMKQTSILFKISEEKLVINYDKIEKILKGQKIILE